MLNYKDYFSKLRSGELPQALLFDSGEEEYTKDSALAQRPVAPGASRRVGGDERNPALRHSLCRRNRGCV